MKLYITACILYFAPLCAQTTGPAIANTHPLMTTDYSCKEGGRLAKLYKPYQNFGIFMDTPPETVTIDRNTYEYIRPYRDIEAADQKVDNSPVCVYPEKAAAPASNIVQACMTADEKGCVDVACMGRNLVEGCPDYKPPAPAKPETQDGGIVISTPQPLPPGCSLLPGDVLKRGRCQFAFYVYFGAAPNTPRLHCTLTHGSEQRLTCRYKPIPAGGKAK